jgi:hypothetical protein
LVFWEQILVLWAQILVFWEQILVLWAQILVFWEQILVLWAHTEAILRIQGENFGLSRGEDFPVPQMGMPRKGMLRKSIILTFALSGVGG